jgi:hypothetical protein
MPSTRRPPRLGNGNLPQCNAELETETAPEGKAWPKGYEAHVKGTVPSFRLFLFHLFLICFVAIHRHALRGY